MAGIPTVLLARSDFLGVVKNAVSGLGFAPETPLVAFPVDLFLPESDLSAVKQRRQDFYEGLTAWKLAADYASPGERAPLISVSAGTYEEAFDRANNYILAN